MRRLGPVLAVLVVAATASAQQQEQAPAPVRPLLDESLAKGTVVVQVVRGSMDKPISGVLVMLAADAGGKPQSARSDSAGKVTFQHLNPGAQHRVQATVDDKPLVSETFPVPESGGVRVLLSPKPVEEAATADEAPDSPTTGGGGGDNIPPMMKDPRRLSGQARPEPEDPAGSLTIRAVQGKFRSTEAGLVSDFPVGAPIILVGYTGDGKATFQMKPLGPDGRARFDKLDRGGTAYYALALFPRKNGIVDRLASPAIKMLPGVGLRMMFAGLAIDDTSPAIDEMVAEDQKPRAQLPGQIDVLIRASEDKKKLFEGAHDVELVEIAASGETVVAKAAARDFLPQASDVDGRYERIDEGDIKDLPPGAIGVGVFRPSRGAGQPGIAVEIRKAPTTGQKLPSQALPLARGITDERGFLVFDKELKALSPQNVVVVAIVYGKEIVSEPFALPPRDGKAVGKVAVADWSDGFRSANFGNVPRSNGTAYYARIQTGAKTYRTLPFQLSPHVGAAVQIRALPDTFMLFEGHAAMEDDRIWLQMRLALYNPSESPYLVAGDQVMVPLPKGFLAGSVQGEEEGMESKAVKFVPGEGVAFRGPLAPGLNDVVIQFAVPVEEGKAVIDWPLPMGLFEGHLMVQSIPGMGLYQNRDRDALSALGTMTADERDKLALKTETRKAQDGSDLLVLPTLKIAPGQRFVLGIDNLPQRSGWDHKFRLMAGITVLGILLWAFGSVFFRSRPVVAGAAYHDGENLMDELVRLESQYKKGAVDQSDYDTRRARLLSRLVDLRKKEKLS